MEIKRIVGKAMNWCSNVVAELDNGLYIWVPTWDEGKEQPIIITKDNLEEWYEDTYAASWLFWDKWVDIMASGELEENLVDIALRNIEFMIENNPPGERYLGASIDKDGLAELKEEEKEKEEWCKENPHAYDVSAYDILLDELNDSDEDDEE